MPKDYYYAENGTSKGPFTLEEIRNLHLSPETLVWKVGLPQWVKLSDMPELYVEGNNVYVEDVPIDEERIWFAMLDDRRRVGPLTVTELLAENVSEETPVWRQGMADWMPLAQQREIADRLRQRKDQYKETRYNEPGPTPPPDFAANPQYGPRTDGWQQQHGGYKEGPANPYGQHNPYGPQTGYGHHDRYGRQQQDYWHNNPYDNRRPGYSYHTNWLPWAIAATIVGLLFSCIGAVFGIIGIVQANKANTFYGMGDDAEGDRVNSNARIMTIIAFVLAGIGLIAVWGIGSLSSISYW